MKELDLLKSKHQTQRPLLHSNQHAKPIPLSNYHVNSDDFYLTLFKINLLLCRHFDISSVLLFNRTFGSARVIIIFSVRHKSHLLVPHLYRDAYDFILHFRWQSVPFAFNFERYLDSSVSLIWEMFLKDCVWLVSRFKLPFRCSTVFFIGGIGAYFCLVYHTLVETFTIQRTTFFNSAVTWPLYFVSIFVQNLRIMLFN